MDTLGDSPSSLIQEQMEALKEQGIEEVNTPWRKSRYSWMSRVLRSRRERFEHHGLMLTFDKETGNLISWADGDSFSSRGNGILSYMKVQGRLWRGGGRKVILKNVDVSGFREGLDARIAEWIDRKIKQEEHLQRIGDNFTIMPLEDKGAVPIQAGRALLLVHGIFSRTDEAFSELRSCWHKFQEIYGSNVYAYDHFTLSKTTKENARDLAESLIASLPQGSDLDIICHSRGAGVVRFLLETEIRERFSDTEITFGKVCFVAGACEGSPWAQEEHVDGLFKVILQSMTLLGMRAGFLVSALALLIGCVKQTLMGFPGVKAMHPSGEFVDELRQAKETLASSYIFVRANYDPESFVLRFGDELIDRNVFGHLDHAGNDLMVPWRTADISWKYPEKAGESASFMQDGDIQGDIHHLSFFKSPDVRDFLLRSLKA